MAAFTFLAGKRRIKEDHRTLGLMVLSQCEDQKVIAKQFEDWEKEI